MEVFKVATFAHPVEDLLPLALVDLQIASNETIAQATS